MYESEFHNSKETKEILEKGSPDIFFRWYYKKKKGPTHHPGDNTVKKPTLSQKFDTLSQRFDTLNQRMDRLEVLIANLAKEMRDGFKQVNTRIDNLEKDINARLDYIVKANNLKDSK